MSSDLQRDIEAVERVLMQAFRLDSDVDAWLRLKVRLTPDRERVQQVIEEMLDLAPTCEKEWDEQLRLWAAMLAAANKENGNG